MFTGIVTHIGLLDTREDRGGDLRMRFTAPPDILSDCEEGDSIAVSGACLTMIDPEAMGFSADVSMETLHKTTLGDCPVGGRVNLELPLRAADRLGGHMVSGHIDGTACLVSRTSDARAERFEFELPDDLARFVAAKGSICLDGISLTVNDVETNRFGVCIIPHTLEVTTFGALRPGDSVNVEVDLIARYLERLLNREE